MERFYAPLWGLRELGIIRFSIELVMLFLLNLIVRSVTGLRKGISNASLRFGTEHVKLFLRNFTLR